MSKVMMQVKLLEMSQNAIALIYAACRQCYSEKFAGDVFLDAAITLQKQEAFVKGIVASGHQSPLEHVKFTFAIEGVSRALTHQLVRHRLASYCLTGDTIIKGARQESSRMYKKFTLKSLYERTLTSHGRSRLKLIRLNSYDENKKVFDKGVIKNIIYSGKQEVWKVKLENGQAIKSTLNHRFFTKDGWRTLKEIIQTKPELGVNGVTCRDPNLAFLRDKGWLFERYLLENSSQEEIAKDLNCSKHTIRSWVKKHGLQKEIGGLHGHPSPEGYHWKLNRQRTFKERMAVSQRMKGSNNSMWRGGITREAIALRKEISIEIRKQVYARDGYQCRLCHNIGGRLTLHHKIPIYANKGMAKDKDNLVTLCQQCHYKINNHEVEYQNIFGIEQIPYHLRSSECYRTIKWLKIDVVESCGIEDTYDIEMCEPHHNFVANGFVVHNSQQSQRYVKEKDFDFIIPPSIEVNPQAKNEFERLMAAIQQSYTKLLTFLGQDNLSGESANQDARFVLPQAAETKIVVTMNCRELLHFFEHRCCSRAQWEIRQLANKMLAICVEKLPAVFADAGAKCDALGYCPEGEKFCCGKYPLKK
ncbi:MAG: FAD-dependent thymidylate synthase [Candidatus Omnitrophica bacterium]|nr:FAD-dependent thymidylate synthase [Candidatus Omnitrophota bacterium]MBU4418336.1 FAD-dependent thymidylate synthase [Candidatus Omnitrophota bacterium]MBU4468380.1 FAD-dependent thymidylate synthase [Candidatus Omnitrophota bacterium]